MNKAGRTTHFWPEAIMRPTRRVTPQILGQSGAMVERQAKQLVSIGGGSLKRPSAPGQPPHTQSGILRSSIGFAVESNQAIIGPVEKYGKIHEYGTMGAGGRLPDIKPRTARALAVPIHKDARGKSPRSFSDLVMLKRPGKAPLLIRPQGKRRLRIDIMYVLQLSVAIPPRPFMRPALALCKSKLAALWKGKIKK